MDRVKPLSWQSLMISFLYHFIIKSCQKWLYNKFYSINVIKILLQKWFSGNSCSRIKYKNKYIKCKMNKGDN